MKIIIHTDGGARGNPGPAGIGVVIEEASVNAGAPRTILASFGKPIGLTTNNVAEYQAILEALKFAYTRIHPETPLESVDCYLDSLLVVQQLNGVYRVKDARLKMLHFEIQSLMAESRVPTRFFAVRRELNTDADALVNLALDSGREVSLNTAS